MSAYKYTPTKPKVGQARLSIWVALIGIIVLLIWASFAKIDQVTRATATVIASARTQEIQASEGGVLTELAVVEGQDVKAGQLLVVLEEERAQAAVDNSASVGAMSRFSSSTCARSRNCSSSVSSSSWALVISACASSKYLLRLLLICASMSAT